MKNNTNSIRTTELQAQKLFQNATKLQPRVKTPSTTCTKSPIRNTNYNMDIPDTTQATYNDTTAYRLDSKRITDRKNTEEKDAKTATRKET